MTNTSSSMWKTECLMLRGIIGFFLILYSLCHAHASIEVGIDLMKKDGGCIESERRSLLAVKAGMYQPPGNNWLSTWRDGTNCCNWQGVGCDNVTGHVVELDLHYPYGFPSPFIYEDDNLHIGPSKLNSSLLGLIHLKHLDVSMNNFSTNPIPEFLGSLVKLEYLNLSNAGFFGTIPPHLGNLSSLRSLDLHSNTYNYFPLGVGKDLRWLSTITSLEYLDMSNVNLSKLGDSWIHDINMLPSLSVLHLSHVDLKNIPDTLPHINLTSLVMLDLSRNNFSSPIPGWLFNITSLRHLDLGYCSFKEVRILKVLASFSKLEHLNLAGDYITGHLPESLGNFSGLINLDFSENEITGEIPKTIGKLYKLQSLDLSDNEITGEIPKTIGKLYKLQSLYLSFNEITGEIPKTIGKLYKLQSLYLNHNEITGEIPKTIVKLYKLQYLDLSDNEITGEIPKTIGKLYKLQLLYLSHNEITGEIPKTIGKLYKLQYLDFTYNKISGKIPEALGSLCKLQILPLSSNKIVGEITSLVEELSRCSPGSDLHELSLSSNNLNGTIPAELGQLSQLEVLDLSSNSFVGNVTEAHFSNLINLKGLRLSDNNHLEMIFSQDWVPPFNASEIDMSSCHLGPDFPNWIRTQTMLRSLGMSEAGISDNIPSWLWNYDIVLLDMSNNQIRGQLPPSLQRIQYFRLNLSSNYFDGHIPNLDPTILFYIDLSNNSFCGPIPSSLAAAKQINFLSLSNNHLSGTIPPFNVYRLQVLDLSNNNLGGRLPSFDCPQLVVLDLSNNNLGGRLPSFDCPWLVVLDLSSNNFSSHIPDSIGSLKNLESLHLGNNSLTGRIPWSLHHCQQLVVLDLGENRLSGDIPTWIGEHLPLLRVLRLRSNFFHGDISFPNSHLTNLQVLDLADNNFSGILSPSSLNFSAMLQPLNVNKPMDTDFYPYKEELMVTGKGMELVYTTVLSLIISIDLSCNGFHGEIPKDLTELQGLIFLNLSRNHFTGEIPENIGIMGQLESLDLSMNNLSGNIPPSISNLNFLSHLNLSHNNLSGRIPSGNQLQSFIDPSIYSGNLELCGWPLSECSIDEPTQAPSHEEGDTDGEKDETDVILIYGVAASGFIIGFWSVIGTLLIKVSWRITYFQLVDKFYDWVYVKLAIRIARWKSIILKD